MPFPFCSCSGKDALVAGRLGSTVGGGTEVGSVVGASVMVGMSGISRPALLLLLLTGASVALNVGRAAGAVTFTLGTAVEGRLGSAVGRSTAGGAIVGAKVMLGMSGISRAALSSLLVGAPVALSVAGAVTLTLGTAVAGRLGSAVGRGRAAVALVAGSVTLTAGGAVACRSSEALLSEGGRHA